MIPSFFDQKKSESLKVLCKAWDVERLSLFGSVLREDFSIESDIDLMVKLSSSKKMGLFEFAEFKKQIEATLGREVDLLTEAGVRSMRNPLRKAAILSSAEVIYVS